ncbi:isopenicillin N synthase family dioxygenase [Granulosicoccus antarcticus]|uniref:2-oxoglutarate-dependent ethylene/succinate-forming enzyme n=1 Tax=Granulosicoccus antarcticus IMCC3135 TaxID=1192854 RepID=A0A2Z2NHW4_9GAMM|nr:2-oxoglutarate and iron-dependent oxygenase domain-containing protein [Granulosicoccus antarcticus]ASJ70896.1 2-oxoglutarate-dependent ethylene/succinate-forming enzyme [Granulosicoccus antarcticus IMCC3135]
MNIPQLDARCLFDSEHPDYQASLAQVRFAAQQVGFMTLTNTSMSSDDVLQVLDMYRRFFKLPADTKAACDMAKTGSNRGWGAPYAEQVDPDANPDFKEVFDSGLELSVDDPLARHTYYAPNRWPDEPADFHSVISGYYQQVTNISLSLLCAIAQAIGEPADYFADKFDKPMALLRGNYYPPRPASAAAKDFGIASHTDYGCLTLLATDGSPGLEVQTRQSGWVSVNASPGTFIINFGEMLQTWSDGKVVATPHRVIGGENERISVPFFFNPRHDVNVAPRGADEKMLAGDHLSARYDQTYVHRQTAAKH